MSPLGVGSVPPGVASVSILLDLRDPGADLGSVRGVLERLLEAEEGPAAGVPEDRLGVSLALFLGDWRTVWAVCRNPWIC